VRAVFVLSSSDPSLPNLFSVLSENQTKQPVCYLPLRFNEARVEFNLSASDNMLTPLLSIQLPVLSENEMKAIHMLLLRLSKVRAEFDLSASANLIAPAFLMSVMSENETKATRFITVELEFCETNI
jgi:hypothetical protein